MHQKTIAQTQIDMIGVTRLEDRQCHKKNLQMDQHKRKSAKRDLSEAQHGYKQI
jgi:hypothetical protein